MRFLLALVLAAPLASASEYWLFLKDGSVGLVDPAQDPNSLTLPDGSKIRVSNKDILFQRTREQADQGVQAIVSELLQGKETEENLKRLFILRAAAAPKLLEFLSKPEPHHRRIALLGLQYGWAPKALEPVLRCLDDADLKIREAAFQALTRNVPEKELAGLVRPWADVENLETAALVFELADKHFPDTTLKRIQRLLRDERFRSAAAARISHYFSPALTEDTLPLLKATDPMLRRAGVVGLIAQLAGSQQARQQVRAVLTDERAELREIAAEYFTWLGQSEDLSALQEAFEREGDAYARSALKAALRTIRERVAAWEKDVKMADELKVLQSAEVLEPAFLYGVNEHERKMDFLQRAFRLQELLAAQNLVRKNNPDYLVEAKPPIAESWIPPVRHYYDPTRKSFGFHVTKEYTSFNDSVHIGDDVGWTKELRTVVAVAPGVVRRVMHVFSWGFIVIIEHHLPLGEPICSLYAHLSPMLHVKPGDIIAAGDKIGSIGRHYTVENGGYRSHVHIGLHRGAYAEAGWICGYISHQDWTAGGANWINPQLFLKARQDEGRQKPAAVEQEASDPISK